MRIEKWKQKKFKKQKRRSLLDKKAKSIPIFLIFLLIIPGFFLIISTTNVIQLGNASSTWKDDFEYNSNSSKSINVSIGSSGELTLDLTSDYVDDDYKNDSLISQNNNLIVNTALDEVQLKVTYQTFGGKEGELAPSAKHTADGGYIITGYTYTYGGGASDAWLLKLNKNHEEQWRRPFGGTDDEFGSEAYQTADGGYVVIGGTRSYGAGMFDAWLIKTDSSGIEQWNKTYGGNQSEWANSGLRTTDGGYIFTGYTTTYGAGGQNVWVLKTNSSGIEQWNKTYGGNNSGEGWSIQKTSGGGFILTGCTYEYDSMGDLFLIKIDSNGNEDWNKTYLNFGPWDEGLSIKLATDGGYILSGYKNYYGPNGADVWLIKLNSTGFEQWNRTYDYNRDDFGDEVHPSPDGGYYIVGYTKETAFVSDILLIKTNNTGIEQWNRTFGKQSGFDLGESGLVTQDGGLLVFAQTNSYGAGNNDFWIFKADKNGSILTTGDFISRDLLEEEQVVSIDTFDCQSAIPANTDIKVQFSLNNSTWFNSSGVLNGWDEISDGYNSINLTKLKWNGPNFYYKMNFRSNDFVSVPKLKHIKFTYTKILPEGNFVSEPFKVSGDVSWKILSWDSSTPIGTKILFQLKSADSATGLETASFVGSNGAADEYYQVSGMPIWVGHAKKPWIQYKIFLGSNNYYSSPSVYNVTLTFNHLPEPPILTGPENNQFTNNNVPIFSWKFNDTDSSDQLAFQMQIANTSDFTVINFNSGEQKSGKESWPFPAGSEYSILPDDIWYWRVRTQDSDGDWGDYSSSFKLTVDTSKPTSTIFAPLDNGFYNELNEIKGKSIDGAIGSGINLTEVRIQRQSDGLYWTGSGWNANKVWLETEGIYDWTYDSRGVSWSSNTKYEIISRAIDKAQNIESPIKSILFHLDSEKPSCTINIPSNDTWLNSLNTISGSSMDTGGSGVNKVEVCIKRVDGNRYWSGQNWVSEESWKKANGTGQWEFNTSQVPWFSGNQYKIRSRVFDFADNNNLSVNEAMFRYDDVTPIYSIKINNDDEETNSTAVNLLIYTIDSDSGAYLMSFSTDKNNWSGWDKYSESINFNLSIGDGVKTVYSKVMDRAGNSGTIVSDTIILNTNTNVDGPENSKNTNDDESDLESSTMIITSGIAVVIIISSFSLFVGSTEIGKYKFLSLVFIPLYNKLTPEKVMDNYIRGQIHGYIQAKPGENYNSIKCALKLKNGTLTHHTKILAKEGLISIKRDGFFTRFYPSNISASEFDKMPLKEFQEELTDIIRHHPGISQHEIINLLDLSQSVISYNLTQLGRNNIIKVEQNGREKQYYINEIEQEL
jgi:predicted transcriptional regulator